MTTQYCVPALSDSPLASLPTTSEQHSGGFSGKPGSCAVISALPGTPLSSSFTLKTKPLSPYPIVGLTAATLISVALAHVFGVNAAAICVLGNTALPLPPTTTTCTPPQYGPDGLVPRLSKIFTSFAFGTLRASAMRTVIDVLVRWLCEILPA